MESFLNRLYGFKSKAENRKYSRYPISLSAQCHFKTGEDPWECRLVDICDQGLGFELDSCVEVQYGQRVLLAIAHPEKKLPVEAIVRLQWIKIASEGPLKQRIGSQLIFMDPLEKAQLLHHAHTLINVGLDKNSFALKAMALRYPKLR